MNKYKFQNFRVYDLALNYIDQIYRITACLPEVERYNLNSQISRAATSIALNIAEGSTGLSDKEQIRYLGLSIRSLLETGACMDLIERRKYLTIEDLSSSRVSGRELFIKLSRFRNALKR